MTPADVHALQTYLKLKVLLFLSFLYYMENSLNRETTEVLAASINLFGTIHYKNLQEISFAE